MKAIPCAAFAALLVLPAAAQSVTVLKHLSRSTNYAGVWGYTAPDGREFALVGAGSGTWIVETTDPVNAAEVTLVSGPQSTWREITSYKQYVYSVSENHGGIRVIDLSNPSMPSDKGYVYQSTWPNTHSISIDPDAGRIYANGTSNGMYILNAAANPLNPPMLGLYTAHYVHDSYIRRGKGYLSEIYDGNLRIVDVTNASSLTTISVTHTPGAFTHNSWVTADDKLMCTTDENSTGFMQVYDISNPMAPVAKGSYKLPGQITHNVFIIGRTAYIACYSAGFHMVDLADPSNPKMLASYDTSTYTSSFHGAWGCYPFQDSGVIYIADIENGLWVLQVDCGHMNRYGKGTAGTGGVVPRGVFDGASPRVAASALRLEVSGLAPNAPYALALGTGKASMTVLGVEVLVDLNGALLVSGTADGSGKASIPLPVPANAALGNGKVYAQLFSADAGGPQGVSASRGMWFGICP